MTHSNSILLTRPLHDSLALQAILQSEGFHCLIAPMLTIKPFSYALKQLDVVNPNRIQALVATSRHAFTLLPARKEYIDKPLYVVGEQTAAAAIAQGWHEPTHIAPTSRMLMPVLKKLSPSDGDFLYLRGEIVTTDMSHHLSDFGWHNIISYQSAASPNLSETIVNAIMTGNVSSVLFFSRRSAQLFEQSLSELDVSTIAPMDAFCLGDFIAEDLQLHCWANRYVAEDASQNSLLDCLRNIHKSAA